MLDVLEATTESTTFRAAVGNPVALCKKFGEEKQVSIQVAQEQHFRQVLGNFPTGVVVVTAIDATGAPVGMAVGSFTSVSLDPPLVAFLPDKSSSSFPRIREAKSFCVNVLSHDQETVCRAFASKGVDKFAGLGWRPAGSGAPILDDVVAWIDCDTDSIIEAGDHYIAIGQVRELEAPGNALPLLFFQGGYGRFHSASLAAPIEPDLANQLRIVDLARPGMERIAARFDVECVAATMAGDEIVLLATAGVHARGTHLPTRVGQRIPLIPPMGAIYFAWQSEDAVRRWLASTPINDEQRAAFIESLRRVRDRDYSIGLGNELHAQVEAELARAYGAGNLAARRAGIHNLIASLSGLYEPLDLDPDRDYDVRNVQVPIFSEDGTVAISLSVYSLPPTSRAEDVRVYFEELKAVADVVMQTLGVVPPSSERIAQK